MASERLRGRPRKAVPLHLVVMRELSNAMRQTRVAAGLEQLDAARDLLNEAIVELYPEVSGEVRTPAGQPAGPHLVTTKYVSDVERGNTSKNRVAPWLAALPEVSDDRKRGSRVPGWLVRAYDRAFMADGYLVDMYTWAVAVDWDHRNDPPRLARSLKAVLGDDVEAFDGAPPEVARVLSVNRPTLADRAARPKGPDWLPDDQDASASFGEGEEDHPEGVLVRPGEFRLPRWVLRNAGAVTWTDRVLYRVGGRSDGIASPVAVPVPVTEPGDAADIAVPIRAPRRPGTYRICLKMGWPDGTYCFPNTLVGVILTVIVPDDRPGAEPYQPWPSA
jgi:Ig-like domain from next to BRCA1 gene